MPPPNHTRICRFGFVNCYLLDEGEGLTLIDTAVGGTERQITAAAGEIGKPIRRIVLTHGHVDHVGSLDRLAAGLEGVEVLASEREAKIIRGDKSAEPDEPGDSLKGGFPKVKTELTGVLNPGDSVGSLEVVAAPGHTPGHIAFRDTRDGTLFCGDSFTTIGGVAVPAKPHMRFPFPYFATWNKEIAKETAAALTALEPARLAPGHGKVIEGPGQAMTAAVAAVS